MKKAFVNLHFFFNFELLIDKYQMLLKKKPDFAKRKPQLPDTQKQKQKLLIHEIPHNN